MSKLVFEEAALKGIAEGDLRDAESLIEAALQHSSPDVVLLDPQGVPAATANLFDGLAGVNGRAEQRHYLRYFDVVAAPGESYADSAQPGDILLERAMGEGALAFAEVITGNDVHRTDDRSEQAGSRCERKNRRRQRVACLGHNQLIVRPRMRRRTPDAEDDYELGLPATDEESHLFAEAAPEPMPLPAGDPVPFASEPPSGSFWPLVTSHHKGREVNYRAIDGSHTGSNRNRQFLAGRDGNERHHVAVDLFANTGDRVIAVDDGRIVNFFGFCCGTSKITHALLVEHSNVVVNYGEVSPDSMTRNGLKIGSQVAAGQVIGSVGRNPGGSSMIHFETYELGSKKNLRWSPSQQRPAGLLNPTRYLLWLQEHGQTGQSDGDRPPAPSKPGANSGIWSRLGAASTAVRQALSNGFWWAGVRLAIAGGIRDEIDLTNAVFLARHPERNFEPLSRTEADFRDLRHEWLTIRDQLVRPALSSAAAEAVEYGAVAEAETTDAQAIHDLQKALNRILGTDLALDGNAGQKTRQAVRQFQALHGLKVDGSAGPVTMAAIRAALAALDTGGPTSVQTLDGGGAATDLSACAGLRSPEVIDRFRFSRADLLTIHQPQIVRIARCIVASQRSAHPVTNLDVVGHTDPVGTDEENIGLGRRRAFAVKLELLRTIDGILPGTADRIDINVSSEGESRPIIGDRPRSRRVEVFMKLPGVQQELPEVPQPDPEPPTDPPDVRACGREGLHLVQRGTWSANSTLNVRGGQVMFFELENQNVLGTTVTISEGVGPLQRSESRIILPRGTESIEFSTFGSEPMSWHFEITTESDAFLVSWELCSTWVSGMPSNPPRSVEWTESFLLYEEASAAANAFVRWVQRSLNQILGLNLATDGVAGTKTRQAIKQFQGQHGLKPDGIVGTPTQQAILKALQKAQPGTTRPGSSAATAAPPSGSTTLAECAGIRAPEVLDHFGFAKSEVPAQHRSKIDKIAQCIVASLKSSSPIRSVNAIGHTDPVGNDQENIDLGRRRAEAVKRELISAIDGISSGASAGVTINPLSEGEKRPIAGDPALSRRVEVVMTLPVVTPVRERRNVTALSATERTTLANAINELRRRGIYQNFISDHANSMASAHRQPAFLPWHRQFILNFETELRAIDSTITLPYWDWSNDPSVNSSGAATWNSSMAALMGGNGTGSNDAVTSGPFSGWTTFDTTGSDTGLPLQRSFGTTSWATSLPTASEVTTAKAVTPYDENPWDDDTTTGGFRNHFEGWFGTNSLHNVVHGWVGGSMLPSTSPNDPCFFLHHCFVDKVWAEWQAANPGMDYLPATAQTRPGRSAAHGRNDDVPVFEVAGSSPVTFKPSESLDMDNLKDHKGTTGIRVRYL